MKEKRLAVPTLPLRLQRVLPLLTEHPALRELALCMAGLVAGFLLAGAGLGGAALPLAVCLIAVSEGPLRALAALLGSALGYLYFWGFSGGLEYLAVGVLLFAAVCIVGKSELSAEVWFLPMLVTAMCMVVGLLFLLQARFSPLQLTRYVGRTLLAAGTVAVYSRAILRRSGGAVVYALACLVAGCAAVSMAGGVTLGQILAVAVCAAAAGTPVCLLLCAVCGLVLDLTAATPAGFSACFCLAGLVCAVARPPAKPLRMLAFLVSMVAAVLLTGGLLAQLVPAAAVGGCLSLLIPQKRFLEHGAGRGPAAARARLSQAAEVLAVLHSRLLPSDRGEQDPVAGVFDRATDRLCSRCVLWNQCWQQSAGDTYRALCAVARPMAERGLVAAGDSPQTFTERCCQLEGLVRAINGELDGLSARRQYQGRLRESRAVVRGQYQLLRRFLLDTANTLEQDDSPPELFTPELGVRAAGLGGCTISGDRGACFRAGQGRYYLLLCDGMGSGPEAAQESADAVCILAGLIRAGMQPRDAMEALNGMYVLRGDGGFSTMDLLEADLATANAVLYKWGAAPSYLKSENQAKRIGTASPPPGFGVGEAHKAAEYQLSLRQGEILVLLSDGADGEGVGRRIANWKEDNPKELAAAIIAEAESTGEDDMTAVALRLRPCSALL